MRAHGVHSSDFAHVTQVDGVEYTGIYDNELPFCVLTPDEDPVGPVMSDSDKGLNMECSKWRNNYNGVGTKNALG